MIFPATFLGPDLATVYEIVGSTRILLGQTYGLELHEVLEQDAVYYLAKFKHTDHDLLKFEIEVAVAGMVRGSDKPKLLDY